MTGPYSGNKMLIEVGDGAAPEVFAAPCGLTTKGINRTANANDSEVPDCDDPDAPVWIEREIQSMSWEVSGSGLLMEDSAATWETWFASGEPRNIKVKIPRATGGRVYSGAALLTALNVTGNRGEKVAIEVTLSGTGPLVSAAIA